jgi:hypothetical protein
MHLSMRWLSAALCALLAGAGAGALAGAEPAAPASRQAFDRGLKAFDEARAYAAAHPSDRPRTAELYKAAAREFVSAWNAGAASTEVFTNAANSFAFAGDTGQAVLFYRRALSVEPGNARAKDALEHIRGTLPIKKRSGGAATSILRSLFFWHEGLSFKARRLTFTLVFPLAFLSLALSLWRRRPFFWLGCVLFCAGLAVLASLGIDALGGSHRSDAVVLTEVQGRLGDGASYSPSHSAPFPPGTEVTILQVRRQAQAGAASEPWLLVRLLDGSESWVSEGAAERVIPRS